MEKPFDFACKVLFKSLCQYAIVNAFAIFDSHYLGEIFLCREKNQ